MNFHRGYRHLNHVHLRTFAVDWAGLNWAESPGWSFQQHFTLSERFWCLCLLFQGSFLHCGPHMLSHLQTISGSSITSWHTCGLETAVKNTAQRRGRLTRLGFDLVAILWFVRRGQLNDENCDRKLLPL